MVSEMKAALRPAYYCAAEIADPRRLINGLRHYPAYIRDWQAYSRMANAPHLDLRDARPQLHDKTSTTPYDPHYFFVGAWAARRIIANHPALHVDVGGQYLFANLLAAAVPTVFVDYRPLEVQIAGLYSIGGDILRLPFADGSLHSLSCLHVAEHIGLGRYGDPLNPLGTRQAIAELTRTLAPGGHLYFALPVGRERVCFNAHRVHQPSTLGSLFAPLELVEFSGVDDGGAYREHIAPAALDASDYACGFYLFKRPA
jgi:SAM-dependent methyltransferase